MQKESICELLYEGQLDLSQTAVINNPQYDEANISYRESLTALYDTFNNEQEKLFDDFTNKSVEKQDAMIYRAFKLGIKMAIEVLDDIRDIPLEVKTN